LDPPIKISGYASGTLLGLGTHLFVKVARLGDSDGLGLVTHLFVKEPRPGGSEVIFSVFESSFHLLLTV